MISGRRGARGRPSGSGRRRHWRLVRADRTGVPSPAGAPRAGRLTRRRRLIRSATVATVLVVAGGGAGLLYGTEWFAVSRVTVTGVEVLTADEVRRAAGVRTGTPLAGLDAETVTKRVSRLKPVERVAVRRDWPDAVAIDVTERTPVAVVPSGGDFLVMDGTGVVFDEVTERPRELPLVELAEPGPDDPTTRDALRVLAALTPDLHRVLVKLAAPSQTRIRLHLTKHRSVFWGDATSSVEKAQAAAALLKRASREIDVSAPTLVTTR